MHPLRRSPGPLMIVGLLALAALLGCNFMTPYQMEQAITGTLEAEEPPPADQPPYPACSWQWATQPQPDLTRDLRSALEAANLLTPLTEIEVTAFGEDCIDADGNFVDFAAMQTDFDVLLPLVALDDRDTVGSLVADVLTMIVTGFPVDETPGPMPGRIILALQAGDETLTVQVGYADAADLVERSVTGARLLAALDDLGALR